MIAARAPGMSTGFARRDPPSRARRAAPTEPRPPNRQAAAGTGQMPAAIALASSTSGPGSGTKIARR